MQRPWGRSAARKPIWLQHRQQSGELMKTEVRDVARSGIMPGLLVQSRDFIFYSESDERPPDGCQLGKRMI